MFLLVFANSVRPDGFTDRVSPGVFNSLTVFFPDVFTDNVLLSVFNDNVSPCVFMSVFH